MKHQRNIFRVVGALVLLTLSVAIRSYSSVPYFSTLENAAFVSTADVSSAAFSAKNTSNYLNLICEDDNADDDDNNHACLSLNIKKKARVLIREKHFCYLWQSSCTAVFFSSDTSPPLV